jgi:hypothetical protein
LEYLSLESIGYSNTELKSGRFLVILTVDLLALDSGDASPMGWQVAWMGWIDPLAIVRHSEVFTCAHDEGQMSITTTSSGGNAGSVVAELALEELQQSIGGRTNDRHESTVRESEVVSHRHHVDLEESQVELLTGRKTLS